jgi:hypothetical protein
MRIRTQVLAFGLVLCCGAGLVPATAQERPDDAPSYSSMINIDALIDNYARLLARKYDLNDEQDTYTQTFLRDKAYQFLDQHREELFALVDEMFAVRRGGEITQEEIMAWGLRAQPLFDDARQLIVEGNREWRGVLNEEQKLIHDRDLELMYDSFATTEEQLGRIISGEMTVQEFRRGYPGRRSRDRSPTPSPRVSETPTPAQPTPQPARAERSSAAEEARQRLAEIRARRRANAGGREVDRPSERRPNTRTNRRTAAGGSTDFEGEWEKYVREFIARYQLNDAQKQRAEIVLKSCQEQAASYMAKRKASLEAIDKRIEELKGEKDSAQEVRKLTERKTKMLEPVQQIFEKRLKPRLERLPTRAQRAAAEKGGRPNESDRRQPPQRERPQPEPEPEPEPEPDPEEYEEEVPEEIPDEPEE